MTIAQTVTDLQNTMFDQVISFQSRIVDFNRDLAGRFSEGLEKIPGMPGLPVSGGLPVVDDAIEANKAVMDNLFDLSTKMIDAQRNFTSELMSIWAPVPAKAAEVAKEGVSKAAEVASNAASTASGKSTTAK